MGTIAGVDGSAIVVKTKEAEVKVNLTDNVAVFGVEKATLADLKAGRSLVSAPCRSLTAARRRSAS